MAGKRLISRLLRLFAFVVFFALVLARAQNASPETSSLNQGQASSSGQHLTALSIADSLATRQITTALGEGVHLSPDGDLVAYTVGINRLKPLVLTKFTSSGLSQHNAIYTSEVWITNLRSGETRKLAQSSGDSWSPVWSPDGQSLAFFSDRDGLARLWLWERSSGNVRQVSDVIVRSVFSYQSARWSPDGRKILMRVLHPATPITGYFAGSDEAGQPLNSVSTASESKIRVFEYPIGKKTTTRLSSEPKQVVDKFDFTDRYFADLALVEVATGKYQRIAQGVFPSNYWFNPQGDFIAYLSKTGQEASNPYSSRFDLLVVSLKDGESRAVATDIEQNINFSAASWSPEGKRLSLTDKDGNVFIASAVDKGLRKSNRTVGSSGNHRAPLWDVAGRFVYSAVGAKIWRIDSNDGAVSEVATIGNHTILHMLQLPNDGRFWSPNKNDRSLVVVTQDVASLKMGFYSVDLASGKPFLLFEDDKVIGNFYSVTFQVEASYYGQQIVFTAEDAQHPQDIWCADAGFSSIRQVTHVNPQLEHYGLGRSRIIEWNSLDGRKLRGAILLPSDYQEGKRYPLVTEVYGGNLASRQANFFNSSLQILATRGYAVLQPDAPLSRKGMPMSDLAQTVLPGVDKAIELGVADPERLTVMGHSFGGYSTLALIVQTTRFKAAVVHAGVGDLISHYGFLRKGGEDFMIGAYETGYLGLGGTPWSAREKYIENSPTLYLDRVETPVLLTHGTADDAVPASQAEEIFVGLRRLGKTVTLVEYEGEGHALLRRENIVDWWDRILRFLEKYIGQKSTQEPTRVLGNLKLWK